MNRREFISRAAGLGLATQLPFWARIPVGRANENPPTRVIFFCSGNESIEPNRWRLPEHAGGMPMQRLHPLMASLEAYRPRLTMFGHHIATGSGHPADKSILTGMNEGMGKSIDQMLADAWGVTPYVVPGSNVSYRGPNAPSTTMRAHEAFAQYFGDGSGELPPEVLARRAKDQSLLDHLSGQLSRLMAQTPQADRYKLEAHLEGIRDLEKRLEVELVSCDTASSPDPQSDRNRAPRYEQDEVRMDVVVQSMACNATRVGVFSFGSTWGVPGYYLEENGYSGSPHNLAHAYDEAPNPEVIQNREMMERVTYENFARLLAKLDAVPEGEGTLLDNTLVVFIKWMGYDHSSDELMWLAVGGHRNAAIRHDRFVDVTDRSANDLLAGFATSLGVPTASWGASQSFFESVRNGSGRERARVLGAFDMSA